MILIINLSTKFSTPQLVQTAFRHLKKGLGLF